MLNRIRKSLSAKLSLSIIVLAVPAFIVSLGILFTQSRHIIRKEAVGRANSVLSTTLQRVNRNMQAIKTATDANMPSRVTSSESSSSKYTAQHGPLSFLGILYHILLK